MQNFKRLLVAISIAALTMLSAAPAFADNPHAGNSGHFKGSAGPCDSNPDHPKCPPFGG